MRSLLALAAWALLAWLIFRLLGRIVVSLKKEAETGPGQDDGGPVRVTAASEGDSYGIPPESESSGECWAPPGRQVTVKGYTIPDGMIYVGGWLSSLNGYGVEPALINPDLPVDDTVSDPEGSSLGYWPSYSRIPPHARGTYLGWLAGGREDPGIGIGYVFLFFYGIERRCLAEELNSEETATEKEALVREVERLLSIYENHNAFRRYACRFLEYLSLCQPDGGERIFEQPPAVENDRETPLKLEVGLARMAANRIPVPSDWALAWALSHHETKLRTPAKRCEKEFRALFRIRYEERFGEGMILEAAGPPMVLTYRAASASFGREVSVTGPLYDVTAAETQVRKLTEIVSQCQEELDGYSRLLGKNPEVADSLPALALLPTPLFPMQENSESAAFKGWLDERLGEKDLAAVDSKELIQRWPTRHRDRMLANEAVLLVRLLEKWSLGLEPDPRFGGPPLRDGHKALIFPTGNGGSNVPSENYISARILVHLSAMVSGSDGGLSDEERRRLLRRISRTLDLTSGEEIRLQTHFGWLLEHPPDLAGTKQRVKTLPEEDRRKIGRALIILAADEGELDQGEERILKRICEELGLDHEEFSGREVQSPVSGRAAEKGPVEAIPLHESAAAADPRRQNAGVVVLDVDRLRRIREDTAKVSAMLAQVFSDEEDPPFHTPLPEQVVAGLDHAHSALLKALGEKEVWPRTEFEDLAAQWGLLPEGALENLNEAAWDRADGALCEDEDPILVDHAVLVEMLS